MKNRILKISLIIFVIIIIVAAIYLLFQLRQISQPNEDKPQVFQLKIGEEKIYKGEFNLKLKLMKIGKINEIINTPNLYDSFPYISGGTCIDEACSNYAGFLESNYYVIKVENIDVDWECRQKEIYINEISYYGCPDSYLFEINSLNSNDNQVEFTVSYSPTKLE